MAESKSDRSPAEIANGLTERGVGGILVQMAKDGQLHRLRCEMPSCYCPKGRGHFESKANPMPDWAPNPDHYPTLKAAGGKRTADNIRLAHTLCNRRDHEWRTQIRPMLVRHMSLDTIAEKLNQKKVPPPHGTNRWSAKTVRKAYVS